MGENETTVGEITKTLRTWESSSPADRFRVFQLVYPGIRRRVSFQLRGNQGAQGTYSTGDVFHEMAIKLVERDAIKPEDSEQLKRWVVEVIRTALIDRHRKKQAQKRGGDLRRVPMDVAKAKPTSAKGPDLISTIYKARAIDKLEQDDPEALCARLLSVAGFTEREIACHLNISTRTLRRRQKFVDAFLLAECGHDG